jgi:hypothetical protein
MIGFMAISSNVSQTIRNKGRSDANFLIPFPGILFTHIGIWVNHLSPAKRD